MLSIPVLRTTTTTTIMMHPQHYRSNLLMKKCHSEVGIVANVLKRCLSNNRLGVVHRQSILLPLSPSSSQSQFMILNLTRNRMSLLPLMKHTSSKMTMSTTTSGTSVTSITGRKPTISKWFKTAIQTTSIVVSTIVVYAFYVEYQANYMTTKYLNNKKDKEGVVSDSTDDENLLDPHSQMIVALPRIYDWDTINVYWLHRPISTLYRLFQINYYLLPILYNYVQDFVVLPKIRQSFTNNRPTTNEQQQLRLLDSNIELQRQHAVRLKDTLTILGPAFVKAGQQISIRPDIVSPTVLSVLQQLCDNVTPISDEMAYCILRKELNLQEITDLFVEPPQLVASASLGQVYRGKLRVYPKSTGTTGENGKSEFIDVAIKVQRPGTVESFSLDLFLLQRFSIFVDMVTSVCTNQPPFHKALYESFASGSYMELDYVNEAKNQIFFYNEIQNKRNLPVVIPKVYMNYTTRTVLISQWIDGIKLADAPIEKIRQLIPVGVELFLTQLLDLGIFHADPHVGNLLVQNSTGKLCLIDFGLCTSVSEQDRRAMTMAIVHMLQRDFATLIHEDSKQLGFLPYDCDTTELYPILTKVLTVGLLDNPTSNIRVRRRKLLEISNELNDIFFHYPFTVPPYFALITRGLGLLEGIALTGDEDFDIFQAAAPYARRRAMQILYGRMSNKNDTMNKATTDNMNNIRSTF